MKKTDILVALIIGEASALLALMIFKNIRLEIPFFWTSVIFLPVLTVSGLWIANLVGKRFLILWQAAKFGLVGILNTLVDLGILNFLLWATDTTAGLGFSIFKGMSFTVAVVNSYFWNKFWTFKKKETASASKEFTQFFVVALIGFGINVGVASLVVNVIGPQFGLSEEIWANFGAMTAAFAGMAWNFLGYKFIVFK